MYRSTDEHRLEVKVTHGCLVVPFGVNTSDFAEMEEIFRAALWPKPQIGWRRWRRELRWMGERTMVEFAVYDVPEENRERPLCRHCGLCPITRTRGLCWSCWNTPEIKSLYPPKKVYERATPQQRACSECGCFIATGQPFEIAARGGRCTTCCNPDPVMRAWLHARLARYEKRAAAMLPLFSDEVEDVAA